MRKEIEIQNENVQKLLKLSLENPELKIVAMVDSDIVCSDDFTTWQGSFGSCAIDEFYDGIDEERLYFRSCDEEDLVEKWYEWIGLDYEEGQILDDELEKLAEEKVNSLPWEKVIAVSIGLPR